MNKALFLDRDGVINKDNGYVSKREQFIFNDGVFDLLFAAKEKGYKMIVVTNQSGISRGLYTENDFKTLTRWMLSVLSKMSIDLAGVYYCPHAPDENCGCRKPKSGMLSQAIEDHRIDAARSAMIGDKQSDMEAALGAGVKTAILLGGDRDGSKAYKIAKNLLDTIRFLE